jgi:hypothetical protein
MKRSILVMGLILAMALTLSSSVHAVATLSLSDGHGHDISITDNGLLDSNPELGIVSWFGTLGNFTTNVSNGFSKPILDGNSLDLLSFNATSRIDGGSLLISFTDDGFVGQSFKSASFAVGGTISNGGSVQFITLLNNLPFGLSNPVPIPGGAFADSFTVTTPPFSFSNPFSLAEAAFINLDKGQNISFDAQLNVTVPEPGIIVLLGTGLAGLGIFRMRRKNC